MRYVLLVLSLLFVITLPWKSANPAKDAGEQQSADPVCAVMFSPDSKQLLATNGTVFCLWDVATGKRISKFNMPFPGRITGMAMTPSGRYVLASSDLTLHGRPLGEAVRNGRDIYGELVVFEVFSGKVVRILDDWEIWQDIAISSDGSKALSTRPGRTTLWDLHAGISIKDFNSTANSGSQIAFVRGNKMALVGASGGPVFLNLETGTIVQQFETYDRIQFVTPDRSMAVLCRYKTKDAVYLDVARAKVLRDFPKIPTPEFFSASQLSPDYKRMVFGEDIHTNDDRYGRLSQWDIETGEVSAHFHGGGKLGAVYQITFSPDGTYLVSDTLYGDTLRLWDVASGAYQRSFTVR